MDNQPHSDDKIVGFQLADVSDASTKKIKFHLLGCLSIVSVLGIIFYILPGIISLRSFVKQAHKAKESEAKQYVGTMNRAQQAKFAENRTFANSIDELELGIKTETTNYKYSVNATKKAVFTYGIPSNKYANEKVYFGSLFQWNEKVEELKGYVGAVFLLPTTNQNETTTVGIMCRAISSNKTRPANPLLKNGQPKCGAGTEEIRY